jgi:hypothetical protein
VKPSSPSKKCEYDRIFKLDAVQFWRAGGKSAVLMAEELGLKPSQLRAQFLDENTTLRQELEWVCQPRDILKKSLKKVKGWQRLAGIGVEFWCFKASTIEL